MEKLRSELTNLPKGLFSILTIIAILWLTLAPKPLGDEPPQLFPGADKIVHGIMFGGLTAMLCLDRQRKTGWRKISGGRAILFASFSTIFGALIEVAQSNMGLGRSFEYEDIAADSIGAYLFAVAWLMLQKHWITR